MADSYHCEPPKNIDITFGTDLEMTEIFPIWLWRYGFAQPFFTKKLDIVININHGVFKIYF